MAAALDGCSRILLGHDRVIGTVLIGAHKLPGAGHRNFVSDPGSTLSQETVIPAVLCQNMRPLRPMLIPAIPDQLRF